MAFLDQISKNLAGYGKEAAKKAKDTAEIFQLKAEIRGEKQKINELYAAIGAVYFKNAIWIILLMFDALTSVLYISCTYPHIIGFFL